MEDKLYTIFVSSTHDDLIEERRIVREAIVRAGHIPIGMEYFTPGNQEKMEFIKPLIDKSDFFILIVGGRYGSINKDTKKSYTEMEYDYAIKQGVPVASFLLTDEAIENLPVKHVETSRRNRKLLGEFRTKVNNKMCKMISNKDELNSFINQTITNLIKECDSNKIGWIRSSDFMINIRNLSKWGIHSIFKTRSLMNEDCDIELAKLTKRVTKASKQIDVICLGLRTFRTDKDELTNSLLKKGVIFRILTIDPNSEFVFQKETEESRNEGYIKDSILELVKWANKKNADEKNKGKIIVKAYKCMPLDYCWHVGNSLYVSTYLYGVDKTINFKYINGDAIKYYTLYFDNIWSNDKLSKELTILSNNV